MSFFIQNSVVKYSRPILVSMVSYARVMFGCTDRESAFIENSNRKISSRLPHMCVVYDFKQHPIVKCSRVLLVSLKIYVGVMIAWNYFSSIHLSNY